MKLSLSLPRSLSIFIFSFAREMKCLRHKIHLNLFLSVLTANLSWVLSYAVQVSEERQLSDIFIILHYTQHMYVRQTRPLLCRKFRGSGGFFLGQEKNAFLWFFSIFFMWEISDKTTLQHFSTFKYNSFQMKPSNHLSRLFPPGFPKWHSSCWHTHRSSC